jgi:hypothetical protein
MTKYYAPALLIFLGMSARAQQPNITFAGLPNFGIEIRQTGATAATISNGTTRTILAFSVQWIWLGADGSPQSTRNVTYTKADEKLHPELPPGSSRSISVSDFESLKREYSHAAGAQVLLDAVVFDDGTVVGPDRTSTTALMQSRAKARQDVLDLILARSDISTPEDVERVVNESLAKAVGNAAPTSTMTVKAAQEYKLFYQAHMKSLIRIAQKQGVAGLRQYATDLRTRYQETTYRQKPL